MVFAGARGTHPFWMHPLIHPCPSPRLNPLLTLLPRLHVVCLPWNLVPMAQLVVCLLKLALCKLWSNWHTVPFGLCIRVLSKVLSVFKHVPSKPLYKPCLGNLNNVQLVVIKLGHHAWCAVLVSLHAGKGLQYFCDDHVVSCPLT